MPRGQDNVAGEGKFIAIVATMVSLIGPLGKGAKYGIKGDTGNLFLSEF